MTNVSVRIRNIVWRGGRPRFEPGPSLRALGFAGEDLKHPDLRVVNHAVARVQKHPVISLDVPRPCVTLIV